MKANVKRLVKMLWVLLISGALCAEDAALPPFQTQWYYTYSQDNWVDHRPQLIRTDSEGIYIIGQSHFIRGQMAYERILWVWRLDSLGKRVWSQVLLIDKPDDNGNVSWESNVVCLKNERLVMISETGRDARLRLIRFDEHGNVVVNKRLDTKAAVLRQIVRVDDGYLIALGDTGTEHPDAGVVKIDAEGNVIWKKKYDQGKSEDAMSIAAHKNGGFVIAANCGEYNKFGAGSSEVWLVKCNDSGDVLTETTFTGRHPQIVAIGSGYAVTYNVVDFPAVDMHVSGFDENFNKIWNVPLYKGHGVGIYQLLEISPDKFCVCGSMFGQIGLWLFSEKGQKIGEVSMYSIAAQADVLADEYIYWLTWNTPTGSKPPRDENNNLKKGVHWDIDDIFVMSIKEAKPQ